MSVLNIAYMCFPSTLMEVEHGTHTKQVREIQNIVHREDYIYPIFLATALGTINLFPSFI